MVAFSLFSRGKTENIKSLKSSEFKKLLSENTIQLVDVRTAEEYKHRKIESARLIDIYDPNFEKIVDTTLDVSIPVAVYCHTGPRAISAARILAKKGFTVYNLRGGILFWR